MSKHHKAIRTNRCLARPLEDISSLCKNRLFPFISFYFLLFYYFSPFCPFQRKKYPGLVFILMEIIDFLFSEPRGLNCQNAFRNSLVLIPSRFPSWKTASAKWSQSSIRNCCSWQSHQSASTVQNHVPTQEADICSAAVTVITRLK